MQTMEQFSHDLTLALALTLETSRTRVRRRRTCSTGNLPCAPQPTEDSSTDAANDVVHFFHQNPTNLDEPHSIQSGDSDDRDTGLPFSFKNARCMGNFESDSLNENFSPARFFRPNTRRKRKLKRMAVEYETTPSTPGAVVNALFPLTTGAIKKRVSKPQDSCYRTNLFFCGKRKRSHRDRYYDYHDHHMKQHSSSAPRQCHMFAVKNSLIPGGSDKNRVKPLICEKILPLNKCLVSKIEKISQQNNVDPEPEPSFNFTPIKPTPHRLIVQPETSNSTNLTFSSNQIKTAEAPKPIPSENKEMTFIPIKSSQRSSGRKNKNRRHRRNMMKNQLQFEDPNSMECGDLIMNDFLSSSSLSSSDSEGGDTNESDREGDDELTDWPGNEVMVNFASKNDFKRRLIKKSNLPLIKSDDYAAGAEDDTLMSGDEPLSPPELATNEKTVTPSILNEVVATSIKHMQSSPIAINNTSFDMMQQFRFPVKQIESEMSGETSNHTYMPSPHSIETFVGTDNTMLAFPTEEIREFRSGCRRINNERPGFTVKISVNERLSKFLQDGRQTEILLNDFEMYEQESLANLAKMYSLTIANENGCAILKKTSNTTQSTTVDQHQFQNALFLSDYKRICYDGGSTASNSTLSTQTDNEIADITSGRRRTINEDQQIQPNAAMNFGSR